MNRREIIGDGLEVDCNFEERGNPEKPRLCSLAPIFEFDATVIVTSALAN